MFLSYRPRRLRILEKMVIVFFFALAGAAIAVKIYVSTYSGSSGGDASATLFMFIFAGVALIGAIVGMFVGFIAAKFGRFNLFNYQGNVVLFGLQWAVVSGIFSEGITLFRLLVPIGTELTWSISGLIVGIIQWMILPLKSTQTRLWILVSLLTWPIHMWVDSFLRFQLNLLGFAAAVAFVGLLVGSLQWYILRRLPNAEWLITINVVGVLVNDLTLPLLSSANLSGYRSLSWISFLTNTHLIYWVAMGIATGWLLQDAYRSQVESTKLKSVVS